MIASRLGVDNLIFIDNGQLSKLIDLKDDTIRYFKKSTNQNLLNYILAKKVILVEGNAEFILMENFFQIVKKKKPEDMGVSIISVGGLSFERYLEFTRYLTHKKVAVLTDNDNDYENKIDSKYASYSNCQNIQIFSDQNNDNHTFEICLFNSNKNLFNSWNFAKTKNLQKFMLNNKAEFALRLLEKLENDEESREFKIPEYIRQVIEWITKN
ncbi:ATP-dependent endonuclease [Atopobacter sp. AH10]|uniref:ATP-dependent endonuclease n=1 Tax=Atopobacter sp. AH10 TaxID=2315861 RepID=UPI000EF2153E|nr:ATP-dependent endonuclease [Atopobacter sp. AH10]RLK62519.1 ATP-dependent endonuclease [Atopobacter sp. AH10]